MLLRKIVFLVPLFLLSCDLNVEMILKNKKDQSSQASVEPGFKVSSGASPVQGGSASPVRGYVRAQTYKRTASGPNYRMVYSLGITSTNPSE